MRKIFIVAAIFTSSQLSAQTASLLQDSSILENLTLTASKYSVKTTQTGKVVTIISRQEIERAGSRDLSQVITELGGVFISGYTHNPGKEKNIYLRGAKAEHTLIVIDGIPVYNASGIGSNFDLRNISIDNVERIEILKGSQSTLYGSDAIAGVIHIITRKNGTKPFSINGSAHYGSYNSVRTHLGANGNNKNFDYNIGYSHFSTDGFSEASQPVTSSSLFDKDGYSQNNVQANFGIQASKKIRLQPFLRYSKNKGDLDNDAFRDELDSRYNEKSFQTGIKNILSLGKSQINLLYQFNKTERSYLDDSTRSRNGFFIYDRSSFNANEHFAEAFIVYPFNSFKLTAGADMRSSRYDYAAHQISPFFTQKTETSGDSVHQYQSGIYAALNYNKNNFAIEGGGRFNTHSEYGSNAAFNINPSYFINNKVKIFGNASSGYKVPSLYQLFSEYGNKMLEPERSINMEGGAEYSTEDGKAGLRGVYFIRRVQDVIAFFFDPVTFKAMYINQDKQKDHGFELDGKVSISEKFQLKILYSYVDGEITTKQSGKDTTYFNLIRRPKTILNISLGSQVTKELFLSTQFNAVGSRKDIYFDPVTFLAQDINLKNYVLVNFYVEYRFYKGRLKLFADIRNVFDEDYFDIYGYNTAGFNAYGGFRFRF